VKTGNPHIDAAVAAGRVTLAVGPAARIDPPAPVPDGVSVVAYVKTPNPTNGSHGHWAKRRADKQRQAGAVWGVLYRVPRETREALARGCVVTMTRGSAGTLDDDGLRSALKTVRDVVAVWLLGGEMGQRDDDPRVVWAYGQEKVKRGVHCVRIEIEPRAALAAPLRAGEGE
jgi:hypothetical protein